MGITTEITRKHEYYILELETPLESSWKLYTDYLNRNVRENG